MPKRPPTSENPVAVRARIRRRTKLIEADMRLRAEQLGKPLEEWDFEELQHGRPRNADGTFRGRPVAGISKAVLDEAQRRLRTVGLQELSTHAGAAIRVMVHLLDSPVHKVRFEAAKYIIDQVIGLPTARIELEQSSSPVAQMLAAVVVNPDGQLDIQHDHEEDDHESIS